MRPRSQSTAGSACWTARTRAFPRAFTLIELLVVIVILGVLMAVALPTYLRQQDKAKDSRTKSYLSYAYHAIRASMPENGQVYAASTTMVSWIQQSEPELTAESGNCITGVTQSSIPTDAIVVDSSSTQTSLVICARSQSGNVWKLTASNTGAQTILDGTLVPLTMSGNEITDTERAESPVVAGHSYDGYANDSSTGIWEGTTNLATNGGFESNTTNWHWLSGAMSLDTTQAKFGTHSLKFVTANAQPNEGVYITDSGGPSGHIAVTAGLSYTVSAWIYTPTGITVYGGRMEWFNGATLLSSSNGPATTVPAGTWTRLTYTATSPASTTGATLTWYTTTQQAATFYLDGVQLEQKSVATPYVETNGSTTSRAAASVSMPASLINGTQGWIAARVRVGWGSTSFPGGGTGFERVFYNLADANNRLDVYFNEVQGQFWFTRYTAGTPKSVAVSKTLTAGQEVTVVASWTATAINLSLDGNSFSTTAGGGTTTLAATSSIGSSGAGSQLDGNVNWFACGTGTLSNADAAAINAWGDTDPKAASFPSTAQATMVWNASSSNGSLK